MRMTFRWFGEGNDTVPLRYIKQIPGTDGVVWSLHDLAAGEEWPMDRILEMKSLAEKEGLHIDVVESVNVHEDIKRGLPSRDIYIERYINTIRKLGQVGVKVICYNFMPVFDWLRTDLHWRMEDGSTAMFYGKSVIEGVDPRQLAATINANPAFTMPGWEPERLLHMEGLIRSYQGVSEEWLWGNLAYFLEAVVPVAAENGIRMAIHPDDPPWPVFGLPRLMTSQANLRKLLKLCDHPSNGITLCSGSLGANPDNDIISMIHEFGDRIPFAHIRNVRRFGNGDFVESSHRTSDGSVDIAGIVKAYHDIGYTGYVRPDHGRQIWDESCRPGYGLYDRALGIMHLLGLWDGYQYAKSTGGDRGHDD